MIAEVIVDIAHSDVDKIFDYACGEEILAGMETFPAQGCIYLRDDVLLIKLGE